MSFDEEQIELLKPIAADKAILHFPFFANTFPLGYHYYRTARDRGAELVALHDWSTPIPVELTSVSQPNIFYATEETRNDLLSRVEQLNGSNRQSPKIDVRHELFTEYIPRIFFLRRTPDLGCLSDQYAHERRVTPSLVLELKDAFDVIEVFTDIPDQAQLVTRLLREHGFQSPIVEVKGWPQVFSAPFSRKRRLEAYFYGAPVSSALEARPRDFIGFLLPEEAADEPRFKTYVCVVAPATGDGRATPLNLDDLMVRLRQYHLNLFTAAFLRPTELRSVWEAYNRDALRRQHNSLFRDPQAFAQCLIDHHKHGSSTTVSVEASVVSAAIGNDPATKSDYTHVHFGAGALGIGLVLPMLTGAKRLAILQRASKEKGWEKLKAAKSVLVSTSAGWQKEMRVIYDSVDFTPEDVEREFQLWYTQPQSQPLLICTSDWDKFKVFVENANTLSCSLKGGQGLLALTLNSLQFTQDVTLFPFENVTMMEELTNPRVKVAKLVADRICAHRKISEDSIRVDAEPFGEVVVLADANRYSSLFQAAGRDCKIVFTDSNDVFRFYYQRKRYLMNSVHMVLTIYSYYDLAKLGVTRDKWGNQILPMVQPRMLAESSEHSASITNFIDTQIIRLIMSVKDNQRALTELFPGMNLEDMFDDLRRYSKAVLSRMAVSTDELDRIFSLDDPHAAENKYNEHLNSVVEFAERSKQRIDDLGIRGKPLANDLLAALRDVNKKAFVAVAFAGGPRPRTEPST